MEKGFYYRGNYYLLPDGYESYGAFRNMLLSSDMPVKLNVVLLRENHRVRNWSVTKGVSMAPYFLSGYHDEAQSMTVEDPEDVYPAPVEVFDQATYNDRLREKILEYCPGCLRYKPLSNRVQSLNGHFEEMGPDGVCMFRQETKPSPRSFRDHLYYFGGAYQRGWYRNATSEGMLEDLNYKMTGDF